MSDRFKWMDEDADPREISKLIKREIEREEEHVFLGSDEWRKKEERQIGFKFHKGQNGYKGHKASSYTYTPLPNKKCAGGIVMAGSDRSLMRSVYMIKPSGAYAYQGWTFPKGTIDKGESREQAALREVREESGIVARMTAGDSFIGTGSTYSSDTDYFLMVAVDAAPEGHDFETGEVRVVEIDECIRYLSQIPQPYSSHKRDLEIAKKAKVMIDALWEIV